MNAEELREYCLSKPCVTESFPFDDIALVFKVHTKMFALVSLDEDLWLNLKCNPERALQLREEYPEITPGYHMNKTHWNTVDLKGNLSDAFLKELINHSYELVFRSFSKKIQAELVAAYPELNKI